MNDHVEIGDFTKYDAFRMNRDQNPFKRLYFWDSVPQKPYKLFKFFMISVIFFKMGKHSDFHLSVFQIVVAWRDLQLSQNW